jgi:hypothetical protein
MRCASRVWSWRDGLPGESGARGWRTPTRRSAECGPWRFSLGGRWPSSIPIKAIVSWYSRPQKPRVGEQEAVGVGAGEANGALALQPVFGPTSHSRPRRPCDRRSAPGACPDAQALGRRSRRRDATWRWLLRRSAANRLHAGGVRPQPRDRQARRASSLKDALANAADYGYCAPATAATSGASGCTPSPPPTHPGRWR